MNIQENVNVFLNISFSRFMSHFYELVKSPLPSANHQKYCRVITLIHLFVIVLA